MSPPPGLGPGQEWASMVDYSWDMCSALSGKAFGNRIRRIAVASLDVARAVRRVDLALRHRLGVQEFTDDEECIFRIASSSARSDVRLSDGTVIKGGEPLIQLHFWNEHLPAMPHGPNAAWASRFKRLIHRSLVSVALHIRRDGQYDGVRALHGSPPFASRIGALQMVRTARRFGFDVIEPEDASELRERWHQLLDSMLLWSLAYAYNPAALRNKTLLRHRYQLWISREGLLALYGAGPQSPLKTAPADSSWQTVKPSAM